MDLTLKETGESFMIYADALSIQVKRQDEGISVYIMDKEGMCITETWATFSEGEVDEEAKTPS